MESSPSENKQVDLKIGGGYHHIRAFHDFETSGHFFDWVHLAGGNKETSYRPAKVLLLYCFQEQHDELVWKAKAATEAETRLETNLSAQWKMEFSPGADTSIFVIDEAYNRYSWALNFLEDERWEK
jgi:hypothetical protein